MNKFGMFFCGFLSLMVSTASMASTETEVIVTCDYSEGYKLEFNIENGHGIMTRDDGSRADFFFKVQDIQPMNPSMGMKTSYSLQGKQNGYPRYVIQIGTSRHTGSGEVFYKNGSREELWGCFETSTSF